MSFSVTGKTAIVTGAANGIGLAVARNLAEAGANVMCADRDEAALKNEFADQDAEAGNLRYFAGDLREKLTQANLLSATLDAFEGVDILINAARQTCETAPLEADDCSLETMLDQNLHSALQLSQLVARRMIKQDDGGDAPAIGAIVNLSSIAAHRTQPELMAYSISVAALDQMTRSLAVALASSKIRVNAVAFGSVMSASLQEGLKGRADWREEILNGTPMARIASATEVAEVVQFLASSSANFITGQILTVDGGRSLLDSVSAPIH